MRGLRIGVTGGLACGKSVVGGFLEDLGVAVLDSDVVAHEMMKPGTDQYEIVVNSFGKGILASNGEIDRATLGSIVFRDCNKRMLLNRIIHPPVIESVRIWAKRMTSTGKDAAVLVPLLFEAGATYFWDAIICVATEPALVEQRLQARGLSPEAIANRLQAQWPLSEKIKRSDYVTYNNGTLEALRKETKNIFCAIKEKGDK